LAVFYEKFERNNIDAVLFTSLSWVDGAREWLKFKNEKSTDGKINGYIDFPAAQTVATEN